MIEIRHLKLITQVAKEGSLTRAAEKLFLSQSALSHQLREIEEYLNTPVFYRLNKKLVLTPSGKVILDAGKEILEKLKKAEQKIQQIELGDAGSLRIIVECYTVYHWLPSLIKNFSEEYPHVEVSIAFQTTQYPIDQLIKGELDLAILCDAGAHPHIQIDRIFDDEMKVVMSEEHPLADKDFVTAEDFEGEHLLIHSLPLDSVSVISKILMPANVHLSKVTQVPLTEAAIEMVKSNIGITTLPQWILTHFMDRPGIVIKPITHQGFHRTWYVATLKDATRPAYVEYFIEKMREAIKPASEACLDEKCV